MHRNKTLITILFMVFSIAVLGQGTAGTVNVSVKTKPNGVGYSPKHVLAIWIEDGVGDFVKTLKLNANKRQEYLYTWEAKSGENTTDATTGSTLNPHIAHAVSWNCTNLSGAIVDDGSYAVKVEYTSEHDQGPLTSISFTKADNVVAFQPADEAYFIDMNLVYTPSSSTGINENTISYDLSVYPNPTSEQARIKMVNPQDRHTSIKIYQSDMKLIKVLWNGDLRAGEHEFTWNLNTMSEVKVASGTYFMVVSGDNLLSTRQIVVK